MVLGGENDVYKSWALLGNNVEHMKFVYIQVLVPAGFNVNSAISYDMHLCIQYYIYI